MLSKLWKQLKSKSASKKPGNSLTFLLTSMTLISVSLTVTSVALGPMTSREQTTTVNVTGVKDVAEHHLDRIEKYIQENPDQFLDTASWNGEESASGDDLPPYKKFKTSDSDFDTFFTTASLKTYTENIKINNIPVTVTSTITWNSPLQSVIRFSLPPYQNVIRIMVRAQAGASTIDATRFVKVSPLACANDKAPTPVGINVPYDILENGDFRITGESGPYLKLGTQFICLKPEKGQTSDLSCGLLGGATGADLLLGVQDSVGTTKTLTHFSFLPGTTQLQITHVHGGSTAGTGLYTLAGTTKDDFAVGVFRPASSDTTNTYQGIVVVRDPNVGPPHPLMLGWAKWNAFGILTSGTIFNATPAFLDTDLFSGAGIDAGTFTFHAPSRMIVATDKTNKQIHFRTITTVDPDPTTAPTIGSVVSSTTPTSTNQGADLFNATTVQFGKPVISKHGDFVVVPVLTDAVVRVIAFSTKDVEIDSNNKTLGGVGDSNIATLMSFNQGSPTVTEGQTVSSLNDIHVWYNASTEEFYWLTRGNGTSTNYLYAWNPKSWGIGPSTGADEWVQNGSSPDQLKRNISVLGHKADTAAGLYTGKYYNVRKIGPRPGGTAVSLWSAAGGPPQIAFDKNRKWFFIRDGNNLHRLDWQQGYYNAIDTQTAPSGQNIAVDNETGWVYFTTTVSGGSRGLYGIDAFSLNKKQLMTSPLTPPDFSDGAGQGDGNIFYSKDNQTLYYLDVPSSVGPGPSDRPKLYAYKPYCYSIGQTNNTAGNLPGFTPQATAWSMEGYDNE